MLETNENYQKTAPETVKYEVHGGRGLRRPPLNHQRYEKPRISRGLRLRRQSNASSTNDFVHKCKIVKNMAGWRIWVAAHCNCRILH